MNRSLRRSALVLGLLLGTEALQDGLAGSRDVDCVAGRLGGFDDLGLHAPYSAVQFMRCFS